VIAYETNINPQTLINRLSVLDGDSSPDAVFILSRGVAFGLGDGNGATGFQVQDGMRLTGWIWVEWPTLLSLLGWLHSLPRIVRLQSPLPHYLAQLGDATTTAIYPEPN
jgi:hypothetical protein